MEIYYQSGSYNKRIEFNNVNYWLAPDELFSYEWSYETFNNRISSFEKSLKTKKIQITVTGTLEKSWHKAMNELISAFEADVRLLTPGRLYVNDWYFECYIIKSSKSLHNDENSSKYGDGVSTNSFTIISPNGSMWKNETTYMFGREFLIDGLTYPMDYPYGYVNSNKFITNTEYVPCDFELTIYGACQSPAVSVGLQTYELEDCYLSTGEYIKINSLNKTVDKTKVNGTKVSVFRFRNRDFNIFEKIPAGKSQLAWQEGLVFDLTLIRERGEPLWIKT